MLTNEDKARHEIAFNEARASRMFNNVKVQSEMKPTCYGETCRVVGFLSCTFSVFTFIRSCSDEALKSFVEKVNAITNLNLIADTSAEGRDKLYADLYELLHSTKDKDSLDKLITDLQMILNKESI